MAEKLSDYLVLEILSSGNYGESCYKVRHKQTHSLYVWKAYDCKKYSSEQINNISNEIKLIQSVESDAIINYIDTILHSLSNTLYVVTELYPDENLSELIAKAKIENIIFDECFIWHIMYQIAFVVKSITDININLLQKQIKTSNIFVTSDYKIKIDAFYLKDNKRNINKTTDFNSVCEIGSIVYEMCTLKKYNNENFNEIIFPFSNDLQNIINILLADNKRKVSCDFKPDVILHHPTVLINLTLKPNQIFCQPNLSTTPTLSNDSAFESDESIAKVGFIIRKSLSAEDINVTPKCSYTSSTTTPKYNSSNILENKSIPKTIRPITNRQLSPTLLALDLKIPGYVPPKVSENVKKWKSRLELCKEPQEVSEEALSQVWLRRLAALREREEAVRLKEQQINKKKIFDKINSKISSLDSQRAENVPVKCEANKNISKCMPGITLQTAMTQKVLNDDTDNLQEEIKALNDKVCVTRNKNGVSLSDGSVSDKSQSSYTRRNHRRSSSVRTRFRKKQQLNYEDMNSSLSADQGDTSILPTSTKISSDVVPRPKSINNTTRRKVHFNSRNNPFAEYDTVSSTTLTFFEIENFNTSYERPKVVPPSQQSIADRIAKFTYLDLEAMTNKKRALMEELRKTPPKVNRDTKPSLKTKVRAAENLKKFNSVSSRQQPNLKQVNYQNGEDVQKQMSCNIQRPPSASSRISGCSSHSGSSRRSISSISSTMKDDRRKPIGPHLVDIDFENEVLFPDENKENVVTPLPKLKKDSKRRSILGFKTPFKFRL